MTNTKVNKYSNKMDRVVAFLEENTDWISSRLLSNKLAPPHVVHPDIYTNEQLKRLRELGRLEERYDERGARFVRLKND